MLTATENAYAKINLFLDVIGAREDGFHNIETVMQAVSLHDTVTVAAEPQSEREITLSISYQGGALSPLPEDERNLAYRAAVAYLERSAVAAKITISIIKRIPVLAGLGGGSADAAATLRALNRIFRALGEDDLISLAAQLGSDVPFCLACGSAFCEGRGEIVHPIPHTGAELYYVIVSPGNAVSTPLAYSELDRIYGDYSGRRRRDFREEYKAFVSAVSNGKAPENPLFNIFEDSEASFSQSTRRAKTALVSCGALCALMSGSGPACFGVFGTKNKAEMATKELISEGFVAYFAESVQR